jgi:hypothetical protein
MGLITGSKRVVVALSEEQIEKLRLLNLDEEDFFRRASSARAAREAMLEKIATIHNGRDWQLDEAGKYLMITK